MIESKKNVQKLCNFAIQQFKIKKNVSRRNGKTNASRII